MIRGGASDNKITGSIGPNGPRVEISVNGGDVSTSPEPARTTRPSPEPTSAPAPCAVASLLATAVAARSSIAWCDQHDDRVQRHFRQRA